MGRLRGILVFYALIFAGQVAFSQNYTTEQLKPDPVKEKMYLPYMATRHGGPESLQEWKKDHTVLYFNELWYFCESFRVKRNHLSEGLTLNESFFDVTRFEKLRKTDEEVIIEFPGYRDVIVLIPARNLVYKPEL